MLKFWTAFFLTVSALCPFAIAQEEDSGGWAVVAKAGTQGFGADVHRTLVPRTLNLRAGASFFQYTLDFSDDGIDYAGQLRLAGVPVNLDYYPFKNWFRLSAGMVINLNRAVGTAKPNQGQIDINGRLYPASQIGEVKGTFRFNRVAPFLGIGFSNPIKRRGHWGVTFDIGGIYHGRPRFPITVSGPLSSQLDTDLRLQEADVEKDVESYRLYPIVQLGISYRLGRK
jgi:hypothetical protein